MIIRPPPKLTNRGSYLTYLEVNLWSWLKDLSTSLLKLSFSENFQSFTVTDLTIKANTEISISNQFQNIYPGTIPSGRIITRQNEEAIIIDGQTPWSETHVYLKNTSLTNDVKISVIFFK